MYTWRLILDGILFVLIITAAFVVPWWHEKQADKRRNVSEQTELSDES